MALALGETFGFEERELVRLIARWLEIRLFKSRPEAVNELLEEMASSWKEEERCLSGDLRRQLWEAMDAVSGRKLRGVRPVPIGTAREGFQAAKTSSLNGAGSGTQEASRRKTAWRCGGMVAASLGVVAVVIFRPALSEDRNCLAADLEPAGQLAAGRRAGRNGERTVATASEVRDRLARLDATLDSHQLAPSAGRGKEEGPFVVDGGLATLQLQAAKQEYENAKAMWEFMKITRSLRRIALQIPRSPIGIREEATKAERRGGTSLGGGPYESQALIEINPAERDSLGVVAARSEFVCEMVRINSERTLGEVVDRLGLNRKWGTTKQQALVGLNEAVSVEAVAGTNMLKIKVRARGAEEAEMIAAAVANTHREQREREEQLRVQRILEALDVEVQVQEDLVEERRKVLQSIAKAGKSRTLGESGRD